MKVEIQKTWFSLDECQKNEHKLYVFGDNMVRYGLGGQAAIRPATNSYGIATKRLPTMNTNAFFADRQDEAQVLIDDIHGLLNQFKIGKYETIVLPADGLGTGLAKMSETSPRLFKWLNETLSMVLNVEYKFDNIK